MDARQAGTANRGRYDCLRERDFSNTDILRAGNLPGDGIKLDKIGGRRPSERPPSFTDAAEFHGDLQLLATERTVKKMTICRKI